MILRFTIGATKRKARDSNPHSPRGETALAGRLGKPYPTTFRSSGPTGSRTRISATPGRRRPAWTMGPSESLPAAQWTAGESNPDLRRAMPASSRWTSSPLNDGCNCDLATDVHTKVRPRIELGPPPYQGGVLPEHLQTGRLRVVPAGLEPALSCV